MVLEFRPSYREPSKHLLSFACWHQTFQDVKRRLAVTSHSVDHIVARLAAVEVLNPQNNAVRLGSLWADQPVVLALVRHFG